jgi:pilus assembly protein CpaB
MLLVALVFGAAAVFFANQWLASRSERVIVASASPTGPPPETIVVAAVPLSFGAALKPENLREIPWPSGSLPEGSYSSIKELVSSGQRRVVLSPLGPNEPVLKWKISGPDARASLSSLVGEGMRAVGIRVNDVVGVGGFVLPGDRVDILFTRTSNNDDNSSTDILIQNTRVLGIDQIVDEKTNQPTVAKVVTVEVNSIDAQKIALAQSIGSLSLSLRSAGSLDKAPAQRVVVDELTSSPSVYETAEAALNARFQSLEVTLAALEDQIASASGAELKQLFASLRVRVRAAIAAAADDTVLKFQLTELEAAIMKLPADFAEEDEELLRGKLVEFEARLRGLAGSPTEPEIEPVAENILKSVGVVRGTQREMYQVPDDYNTE